MYLRFRCTKCNGDSWILDYDTEKAEHLVICLKCGFKEYIEEVFKRKQVKVEKPIKSTTTPPVSKVIIDGIKPSTTSTIAAK